MEASQSLSIDSFSYSWLVNLKPAPEIPDSSFRSSFDASDDVSFIEMDPKLPPSKRFFAKSQDFKFDFPVSPSSPDFAHADELISNGYLVPLVFDPVKVEALEQPGSVPDLCNSPPASDEDGDDEDSDCSWVRKCRKLSKQVLQKYLDFLIPLCRSLAGTSSEAAEFGRRCHSVKRVCSPETSPRTSAACSGNGRRQSSDSESSIYEAVLHCKRSIGK